VYVKYKNESNSSFVVGVPSIGLKNEEP